MSARAEGTRRWLRVGGGIAVFELFMAFLGISRAPEGLWTVVFVVTFPFAIYGLAARLLGRVLPGGVSNWLSYGWALFYWGYYWVVHPFMHNLGRVALPLSVATALGAAVVLWPRGTLDRVLRVLTWAAWPPAVLGLVLWMREVPQVWDVAPDEAPPASGPNLVLISWDTVRADVLGPWGGAGVRTPHLDRLVEEGITFDDAVAVSSITGPSHASMLTGLYPPAHGLRSNVTAALGPGVRTLPEMLAEAGWQTGGFVSAYPMMGRFGFQRGFHRYDDRMDRSRLWRISQLNFRSYLWLGAIFRLLPKSPEAAIPGEQVNRRALAWLNERGALPEEERRPFFLFVHHYDAHAPYEPPERLAEELQSRAEALHPPAAAGRASDHMTRYRAEIQLLDELLGEILVRLEEEDPGLEDTLVVLTSDHGECFGEGGIFYDHVPSLYEATQHVPLVMRLPGARAAGTRVSETVSHLDLAPTFLYEAGIPRPPALDEVASYPLQPGAGIALPARDQRSIYMEAWQEMLAADGRRKQGWRTGPWKLVLWERGDEELWRFREDESGNLAPERPDLAARLLRELQDFYADLPKVESGDVQLSAQDAAAMGELGYTDG